MSVPGLARLGIKHYRLQSHTLPSILSESILEVQKISLNVSVSDIITIDILLLSNCIIICLPSCQTVR